MFQRSRERWKILKLFARLFCVERGRRKEFFAYEIRVQFPTVYEEFSGAWRGDSFSVECTEQKAVHLPVLNREILFQLSIWSSNKVYVCNKHFKGSVMLSASGIIYCFSNIADISPHPNPDAALNKEKLCLQLLARKPRPLRYKIWWLWRHAIFEFVCLLGWLLIC